MRYIGVAGKTKRLFLTFGLAATVAAVAASSRVTSRLKPLPLGGEARTVEEREAALRTYVPPGEWDKYYMFVAGGHSGQVYVYGLPSLRHIRTVPVFRPDSGTGWGFDRKSREMLKGLTWGDVHHAALSETGGRYDGRWLFVDDMANNRVALIDLRTFQVKQILGPLPNMAGPHCSVFVTPNTEYIFMPSRFARPLPEGSYAPLNRFKEDYFSVFSAVKVHRGRGRMELAWQMLLPPWFYDMSDAGKLVSDGWVFLITYNTEEAAELLEIGASQREKDYVVVIDWRAADKAVENERVRYLNGVRILDPAVAKDITYLIPVSRSPHDVNVSPDGRYIVVTGKIAPKVSVLDFKRIKGLIDRGDFSARVRGFPVLDYAKVAAAEIPVGLGSLHTEFGPEGYAYTSLYAESAVVKWQLGTWQVIDKGKVNYNVGHISLPAGDTIAPEGKYLVSLNKMSRGRFLPTGLTHPDSLQLFDVSGPRMRLLLETAFPAPEPHYGPIIRADFLKPVGFLRKDPKQAWAVRRAEDARIERRGRNVTVHMIAVRSHFVPDRIEVNQGDRVVVHLTNIEQTQDLPHGWGLMLYNVNVQVEAGETKTIEFTADKSGVFPYYCTNFCSTLHEEMQGWLLVRPAGK